MDAACLSVNYLEKGHQVPSLRPFGVVVELDWTLVSS